MSRRRLVAALGLPLLLGACSRSGDTTAPTATLGTVGSPSSSSASAPSAKAPDVVDASPPGAGTWAGSYTAGPGPFYVPDSGEWAGIRFRGEDASVGLGPGTLQVAVDRAGRLQGSLDGPLGPLQVQGQLIDDAFAATLVSAAPSTGFAGTAVGHKEGDRITGTMRLSLPTGNVIREAPFALDRKR